MEMDALSREGGTQWRGVHSALDWMKKRTAQSPAFNLCGGGESTRFQEGRKQGRKEGGQAGREEGRKAGRRLVRKEARLVPEWLAGWKEGAYDRPSSALHIDLRKKGSKEVSREGRNRGW